MIPAIDLTKPVWLPSFPSSASACSVQIARTAALCTSRAVFEKHRFRHGRIKMTEVCHLHSTACRGRC
uniref:Uncharacterized protein n=1 Tax=Anguilla anguilla TaxID=7936 RepID=A0A0E9X762_ANGAN